MDDLVKRALDESVNRFLGWRLPDTFAPDAGIKFDREYAAKYGMPTGTNLLDSAQARAMLEFVVGPIIEDQAAEIERLNARLSWRENNRGQTHYPRCEQDHRQCAMEEIERLRNRDWIGELMRWGGPNNRECRIGRLLAGYVSPTGMCSWEAHLGLMTLGFHQQEAEARTAVEKAVREALGMPATIEKSSQVQSVELTDLREEVAFWRGDLAARLWFAVGLHKDAVAKGDRSRAADLRVNIIMPGLAALKSADAKEWHSRCDVCGEFVRPDQPDCAWDEISGHAACLLDDPSGHEPVGDAWRQKAIAAAMGIVSLGDPASPAEMPRTCETCGCGEVKAWAKPCRTCPHPERPNWTPKTTASEETAP